MYYFYIRTDSPTATNLQDRPICPQNPSGTLAILHNNIMALYNSQCSQTKPNNRVQDSEWLKVCNQPECSLSLGYQLMKWLTLDNLLTSFLIYQMWTIIATSYGYCES